MKKIIVIVSACLIIVVTTLLIAKNNDEYHVEVLNGYWSGLREREPVVIDLQKQEFVIPHHKYNIEVHQIREIRRLKGNQFLLKIGENSLVIICTVIDNDSLIFVEPERNARHELTRLDLCMRTWVNEYIAHALGLIRRVTIDDVKAAK